MGEKNTRDGWLLASKLHFKFNLDSKCSILNSGRAILQAPHTHPTEKIICLTTGNQYNQFTESGSTILGSLTNR